MDILIAFAVPVFLTLIVLEAWFERRHPRNARRGYEARDTAASLAMGVGNVVVAAVTKAGAAAVFFTAYEYRLFDIGSGAAAWLLLIPCEDFCYYWFHRASHEVRFLWSAHVNHHSSRHYNLSTALRQSWTTPLTGPIFWVPLALIGFHPLMILTAQAISLIYQFWIHTETIGKLPRPIEWFFNTPSHHRVHHASDIKYLDKNHAGVLIIWDRLFGTFEPERERVVYGLTKNISTYSPLQIGFHEWIAMGRAALRPAPLRDRLGYLFMPPGWSPDGSTKTAAQLRADRA